MTRSRLFLRWVQLSLQVPLNYSNPKGPIATIAMTRIPALVASDSAEYRGPILFNPGGPGGSGVDMIVTVGRHFQSVVGPQFDILGFDPRGMQCCNFALRVIIAH